MMPPESWLSYTELAKLRIETKFIESIRDGHFDRRTNKCTGGSLGTWTKGIHKYFTLKSELSYAISGKFAIPYRRDPSQDFSTDYAFTYLFSCLVDIEPTPPLFVQLAVSEGLKAGDKSFHDALSFIMQRGKDDPWKTAFSDAYDNFTEGAHAITDDDVPF